VAKRLALPLLLGLILVAAWVLLRDRGHQTPGNGGATDSGQAPVEAGAGADPLPEAVRTDALPGQGAEDGGFSFTGARELGIPSFTGTVLDAEGHALANVLISASGLIGWSSSSSAPDRAERLAAEFTARSNSDGRFALPEALRDGLRFEIVLTHPDHAPLRLLNQPAWPGRTRDLGELRLARGFALSGRALTPDGAPVAGAEILAYADPALGQSGREELALDPLPGMGAVTDREGTFRMDRLPPGRIRVRASAEGSISHWSPPLTAREGGQVTDLILQLPNAQTVRGIVLDAARQAVPGSAIRALISTNAAWPNQRQELRTQSDLGGAFQLQVVENFRAVELEISAPGHALVKRSLKAEDLRKQPIEIVLQSMPQVRGFVLDEAGIGVAGAQVVLAPASQTPFHPRDRLALASASSGTDGAFGLDFDIGLLSGSSRLELLAWDDTHAPAVPVRLDLRSGNLDPALFPLRLVLPAGLTLSGRVLTAQGEPVAGARLHLRKLQAPRANRLPSLESTARGGTVVARSSSGKDGSFMFTGLAPGDYRVEAHQESRSPGESEDLALLENLSGVELRLPASCGIAGTVEGDLRALPWLQVQAVAPGREVLEASVDQTGAFRFENMAPGVYSLTLRPSPWGGGVEVFSFAAGQPLARLEEVTVNAGEMVAVTLRMELEGFGSLEGRVQARGGPAADFGVYLFPVSMSTDADPSLSARQRLSNLRRSTTDREGRFAFAGLEAREWLVVLCAPGGEPDGLRARNFPEQVRGLDRRRVTVSSGAAARADFELRTGTLVIEVSNAAERVAGREILLQPVDDAGTVREVDVGRGGARLRSIPSGTYTVQLPDDVSTDTPTIFVPPDGEATLRIVLPLRPPRGG
jgi:hypothetical protein